MERAKPSAKCPWCGETLPDDRAASCPSCHAALAASPFAASDENFAVPPNPFGPKPAPRSPATPEQAGPVAPAADSTGTRQPFSFEDEPTLGAPFSLDAEPEPIAGSAPAATQTAVTAPGPSASDASAGPVSTPAAPFAFGAEEDLASPFFPIGQPDKEPLALGRESFGLEPTGEATTGQHMPISPAAAAYQPFGSPPVAPQQAAPTLENIQSPFGFGPIDEEESGFGEPPVEPTHTVFDLKDEAISGPGPAISVVGGASPLEHAAPEPSVGFEPPASEFDLNEAPSIGHGPLDEQTNSALGFSPPVGHQAPQSATHAQMTAATAPPAVTTAPMSLDDFDLGPNFGGLGGGIGNPDAFTPPPASDTTAGEPHPSGDAFGAAPAFDTSFSHVPHFGAQAAAGAAHPPTDSSHAPAAAPARAAVPSKEKAPASKVKEKAPREKPPKERAAKVKQPAKQQGEKRAVPWKIVAPVIVILAGGLAVVLHHPAASVAPPGAGTAPGVGAAAHQPGSPATPPGSGGPASPNPQSGSPTGMNPALVGTVAPSSEAEGNGKPVQIYWRLGTTDYLHQHPTFTQSDLEGLAGRGVQVVRLDVENFGKKSIKLQPQRFSMRGGEDTFEQKRIKSLPDVLQQTTVKPNDSVQGWLVFNLQGAGDPKTLVYSGSLKPGISQSRLAASAPAATAPPSAGGAAPTSAAPPATITRPPTSGG